MLKALRSQLNSRVCIYSSQRLSIAFWRGSTQMLFTRHSSMGRDVWESFFVQRWPTIGAADGVSDDEAGPPRPETPPYVPGAGVGTPPASPAPGSPSSSRSAVVEGASGSPFPSPSSEDPSGFVSTSLSARASSSSPAARLGPPSPFLASSRPACPALRTPAASSLSSQRF